MFGYLGYAFALALYPLRLALYVAHLAAYFLTKVVGITYLPLAVVLAGWWFRDTEFVETATQLGAAAPMGFVHNIDRDWEKAIWEWRGVVTALLVWLLLKLFFTISYAVLHPVVHAMPAPRRPLFPQAPLHIPKHVIKTVPTREAVKPLGKPRYRGDIASLVPALPAAVQAVLAQKPRPHTPRQAARPEEPDETPPIPIARELAPPSPPEARVPPRAPRDGVPIEVPRGAADPGRQAPPEARLPPRRPPPPMREENREPSREGS